VIHRYTIQFPKQLSRCHKQKDSGNKIEIQMYITKNFICNEAHPYPEEVLLTAELERDMKRT